VEVRTGLIAYSIKWRRRRRRRMLLTKDETPVVMTLSAK
jgi:hypothetical protein